MDQDQPTASSEDFLLKPSHPEPKPDNTCLSSYPHIVKPAPGHPSSSTEEVTVASSTNLQRNISSSSWSWSDLDYFPTRSEAEANWNKNENELFGIEEEEEPLFIDIDNSSVMERDEDSASRSTNAIPTSCSEDVFASTTEFGRTDISTLESSSQTHFDDDSPSLSIEELCTYATESASQDQELYTSDTKATKELYSSAAWTRESDSMNGNYDSSGSSDREPCEGLKSASCMELGIDDEHEPLFIHSSTVENLLLGRNLTETSSVTLGIDDEPEPMFIRSSTIENLLLARIGTNTSSSSGSSGLAMPKSETEHDMEIPSSVITFTHPTSMSSQQLCEYGKDQDDQKLEGLCQHREAVDIDEEEKEEIPESETLYFDEPLSMSTPDMFTSALEFQHLNNNTEIDLGEVNSSMLKTIDNDNQFMTQPELEYLLHCDSVRSSKTISDSSSHSFCGNLDQSLSQVDCPCLMNPPMDLVLDLEEPEVDYYSKLLQDERDRLGLKFLAPAKSDYCFLDEGGEIDEELLKQPYQLKYFHILRNANPFLIEHGGHVEFTEVRSSGKPYFSATIDIVNRTDHLVTFRIECSNESRYRILPDIGCIEGLGRISIEITSKASLDLNYSDLAEDSYMIKASAVVITGKPYKDKTLQMPAIMNYWAGLGTAAFPYVEEYYIKKVVPGELDREEILRLIGKASGNIPVLDWLIGLEEAKKGFKMLQKDILNHPLVDDCDLYFRDTILKFHVILEEMVTYKYRARAMIGALCFIVIAFCIPSTLSTVVFAKKYLRHRARIPSAFEVGPSGWWDLPYLFKYLSYWFMHLAGDLIGLIGVGLRGLGSFLKFL